MPAFFEYSEDILGLRLQLDARDLVGTLTGVLSRERLPFLARRRVEAELNRRLADIRVDRDEDGLGVFDGLPRLPLRGRDRRIVIERENQLLVRVDDVDHDPIVLGELCVVRDDKLVVEVDRAAERRLVVAEREAGGRDRRRRWFFPLAGGQDTRRGDERSE